MGTLAKPAIQFTSYLVTALTVLWVVTVLCDRVYAFHTTYRDEVARRADEEWLWKNCRDPVFYANLKGHTDVCTQVESNARRNLLLFSARQVMQGAYLCGALTCGEQVVALAAWFLQLSTPFMVLVSVMAVVCPLVLVQVLRVVVEAFRPVHHAAGGFYSLPLQPPRQDHPFLTRYPAYTLPSIEEVYDDAGKKGV